jgi:hypothetical protein
VNFQALSLFNTVDIPTTKRGELEVVQRNAKTRNQNIQTTKKYRSTAMVTADRFAAIELWREGKKVIVNGELAETRRD